MKKFNLRALKINWFWKQLDIHAYGSEIKETKASKLIDPTREKEIKRNIGGFSLIGVHVHGITKYEKQFKGAPIEQLKEETNL